MTEETPEVALARQIHKRQALDRGHGPFTTRCICNLHAAEILSALVGWEFIYVGERTEVAGGIVLASAPSETEEDWDPHAVDFEHPCLICRRVTSHDHSTAEWNAALAAAHVSLT